MSLMLLCLDTGKLAFLFSGTYSNLSPASKAVMPMHSTSSVRSRSTIKIAAKVSPHVAGDEPPCGMTFVCSDVRAYVRKGQDATAVMGASLSPSARGLLYPLANCT